ncbi:hypothetical protein EU513_03385 [Yimella sp. RIT 621]|nr:hypothetical protein EU513_03385 [Yimella sp. RIT 621]
MRFIEDMRDQGYAVESVCRVLREQGCQIAARTYRAWITRQAPSRRTVGDAFVIDAIRSIVWTTDEDTGSVRMTPEGLYGRRKMLVEVRKTYPWATPGSVDRAMKSLGLNGVRRSKGVRTTIPAADGVRAGDLLNRDWDC